MIEKVKINLLKLGDVNSVNFQKLKSFANKSKLFSIEKIITIESFGTLNEYVQLSDLENIYKADENIDFTVAIINEKLESDVFSKAYPSEKVIFLTINDFNDFSKVNKISPEKFIQRFIYGFVTLFVSYENRLPEINEVKNDQIMQVGTQGCLFDLCKKKQDFIRFFENPRISSNVESILTKKIMPINLIEVLKKEINTLRISKFSKFIKIVGENPILTLTISFLSGLLTDIIANIVSNFFN